jgi:excisionase family DNA binding protein
MGADPIPARLCDVPGAARYLGLSARSTWSLIHSGRLPRIKLGRLVRVDVRDLDALVARAKRGVDVVGPSLRPARPPPKGRRALARLSDQGVRDERPTKRDAPHDNGSGTADSVAVGNATSRAPTGSHDRSQGNGR